MTDWERCVEFHGHECGGLSIGYRAAKYAARLLNLEDFGKGQVTCVAENNTCSVDAIRCLLGCREEWGNLQFDLTHRTGHKIDDFKTFPQFKELAQPGSFVCCNLRKVLIAASHQDIMEHPEVG